MKRETAFFLGVFLSSFVGVTASLFIIDHLPRNQSLSAHCHNPSPDRPSLPFCLQWRSVPTMVETSLPLWSKDGRRRSKDCRNPLSDPD